MHGINLCMKTYAMKKIQVMSSSSGNAQIFSRLDFVTLESYRRPDSFLTSLSPTVADVTIIAHSQLVKNNMRFEQFHFKSGICIKIPCNFSNFKVPIHTHLSKATMS